MASSKSRTPRPSSRTKTKDATTAVTGGKTPRKRAAPSSGGGSGSGKTRKIQEAGDAGARRRRGKGTPAAPDADTDADADLELDVGEDDDADDGDDADYGADEARKDAQEDDDDEEEVQREYDSDALDDDDIETGQKRKRGGAASPKKRAKKSTSVKPSSRKKPRTKHAAEEEADFELADGQEIVGRVVQAPKTGQGAFLSKDLFSMCRDAVFDSPAGPDIPEHVRLLDEAPRPEMQRSGVMINVTVEPVFRQAETEWKAFVEAFTDVLTEVDTQVPPLPPKDLIHRIYRDVRFSNDKTPYKRNFSASFSRSGRKGVFAGLKPGGESLIAAGSWCPGRTELANIRSPFLNSTNIQNSSARLRRVIAAPAFVQRFGEPCPAKDGSRQNIFGMEDELKVAPKGVDKSHPDIDLLKCRSFAVVHKFTDEEVLAEDFKENLVALVRVMRPFVHCLNDMMTVGGGENHESDEEEEEANDDAEGGGE
ncbi:hypothetical protein H0H81_009961 [Sphagnurus paluster]|uniref:Uncharacterized protein n=1 Tax=Sphagnurus paluster TaxID=117069 RepID=A0A9P7FPM9_9AGAR|nr:hypothetical protein H0H81_009961 [Sphagnurus paluster]